MPAGWTFEAEDTTWRKRRTTEVFGGVDVLFATAITTIVEILVENVQLVVTLLEDIRIYP